MTGSFRIFENGRIAGAKSLAKNKTVYALVSSAHWSCTENNATNAWNVNFNNGNTNGNNKYNTNLMAEAVAALTEDEIQTWIEAYDACCRNKRTSAQCTLYRLNYEEDLLILAAEVKARIYKQRQSEAFCVKYPKVREIFAANFRDRIVQHWIVLHVEPLLESLFMEVGDVSYNCRKGYGTLAAVRKQEDNIRKVSSDWKEEAWVGCGDIQAFFMSIDTQLMWRMYERFITERYKGNDIEVLLWVSKSTILHEPQKNCIQKGDLSLWDILPKHKSLFGSPAFIGMPIGNITTQHLANFMMSAFDKWAVDAVNAFGGTYIRFVDDVRVVARNREDIKGFFASAEKWLTNNLQLKLHPNKRYLQPVRHGDAFVGAVIKPNRTYISNRTRARMYYKCQSLEWMCQGLSQTDRDGSGGSKLKKYASVINSYMGQLVHYNTYGIRRQMLSGLKFFWQYYYVVKFNKIKQKQYEQEVRCGETADNQKHRSKSNFELRSVRSKRG